MTCIFKNKSKKCLLQIRRIKVINSFYFVHNNFVRKIYLPRHNDRESVIEFNFRLLSFKHVYCIYK